jgi:hypothetical protein
VLAALIERIPVVTPPLPEWKRESLELRERIAEHFSKVYPQSLTTAEEGPDRKQARLRAAAIIEDEASREGEGDRTGDESSMDRKLVRPRLAAALVRGQLWPLCRARPAPSPPRPPPTPNCALSPPALSAERASPSHARPQAHRLYLALRTGDSWTLPQVEWAPGSPAVSERLGARVAEACGDAMVVHWVGNAPVAHLPIENGATFYWRLQHVSGTVEVGDGIDGFAWLTK